MKRDEEDKVGAIIGCCGCLLAIIITIGLPFIMAGLIVWIASGLFNADLSDKYWYVFVAFLVISILFGGK